MTPRIYLAIDNCFAYKRWTRPLEWCRTIRDLGIGYVEASADNELDPLFMGPEYLKDWVRDVKAAQAETGMRVANLYSGHGTYTTLGMTHTDPRVRRRMMEDWFKPMIRMSAELGAGFGFYAHAFPESVLQDAGEYARQVELLEAELIELNGYAKEVGCGDMGLEQMYSPHQYPFTIAQTRRMLRNVSQGSGRPFYFTEDVGHHHVRFLRPDRETVRGMLGAVPEGAWLGTARAFEMAQRAKAGDEAALEAIMAQIEQNPNLFTEKADGDCYAWLRALGAYSPIIHLQQTDGVTSAHLPFTKARNAWGIIDGERLLRALKASYDASEEGGMPARCEKIYLTLELFAGTTSIMRDFLAEYRASVEYWRAFVPEDGLTLDALVARLPRDEAPPQNRSSQSR